MLNLTSMSNYIIFNDMNIIFKNCILSPNFNFKLLAKMEDKRLFVFLRGE